VRRPSVSHLARLEAESIYILRETVAEMKRPVMLFSTGKDSCVMLRLAQKAFFPAPLPFPLLHVNTGYKFRQMIEFRDRLTEELGFTLLEWTNPDGLAAKVNPFDCGTQRYTQIMKTDALKQAMTRWGFDAALGGARRDEEMSRAKERIFSYRDAHHVWDPARQRPEPFHIYNTRIHAHESMRVFPLSNWTELDVWLYVQRERIAVVPLYFAAPRPVVERRGALVMVDDERLPLLADERPRTRTVRFRTLGCYPLTGAVESRATTVEEIVEEIAMARTSERQGRVIDYDEAGCMEDKKREGYF